MEKCKIRNKYTGDVKVITMYQQHGSYWMEYIPAPSLPGHHQVHEIKSPFQPPFGDLAGRPGGDIYIYIYVNCDEHMVGRHV